MNKRIIQIGIHITAWACFLMLPLVFFPRPKDNSLFPEQAFNLYFVLINLFYIAFYYFNSGFLIPKLLEQKKTIIYTIIIFCFLIFVGMFPRLYEFFFGDIFKISSAIRAARPRNYVRPLLSPAPITIFLLVFIFSTGIKVIHQWLQTERRNKLIENEKLNTELSFLKAQINPHFLFNTLNNIYSLAADRSELTAPAVMKLSSIMRYVLTEAKNDSVSLEKEIQFLSDYIELQKMRTTSKTVVQFTVKGETSGKQVSPLLLLSFVENAFKYGISAREPSPIDICMDAQNGSLLFKVKNNKHNQSQIKAINNTGIGIQNARRRLELLYPNKYQLQINDDPTTYTVNLQMDI